MWQPGLGQGQRKHISIGPAAVMMLAMHNAIVVLCNEVHAKCNYLGGLGGILPRKNLGL